MRLEFSTGYHIDALRWDQNSERAIGPNRDGQSADEINGWHHEIGQECQGRS